MILGDSGKSLRISLSARSWGSFPEKKKFSLTFGFKSTAAKNTNITSALAPRQARTGKGFTRNFLCCGFQLIGFFTFDSLLLAEVHLLLWDIVPYPFGCTGISPTGAERFLP
jgi:hypothetical protein